MDRRAFVTLIAGTCVLEPLAVRAQQAGKIFRIGLLVPRTQPDDSDSIALESLRMGLRGHGWVEGRNLVIETRWAGVNPQRQRELAAELKALQVALILALGTTAVRAAHEGAHGALARHAEARDVAQRQVVEQQRP